MSWVITKHLCKSAGNNIWWRIGNYNKYSLKQCQVLKKIYTSLHKTKKYKEFSKIIDTTKYDIIDEYMYCKSLSRESNWVHRHDNYINKVCKKFYKVWNKYYTNFIADKIFENCAVRGDVLHKYN